MAEKERALAAKWAEQNGGAPAEFRKEVRDKAMEASVLAWSLLAAGHFELGASAMARSWFLSNLAKELSEPWKSVIVT